MHFLQSLHFAKFYESVIGRLLKGLRLEVLQMTESLGEQQKILDCCCGCGGLLYTFLQSNKYCCTGLDNCPHMLAECKKNAQAAQLFLGDARYLPFAEQSFDVATLCMALHAMPLTDAKQVMQELQRVAKYIIVADYCLPERNIALPANMLAYGIEALVGGDHYSCYKEFQKQGGLEGFLYGMGISPLERRMTLCGAGMVVLICT